MLAYWLENVVCMKARGIPENINGDPRTVDDILAEPAGARGFKTHAPVQLVPGRRRSSNMVRGGITPHRLRRP